MIASLPREAGVNHSSVKGKVLDGVPLCWPENNSLPVGVYIDSNGFDLDGDSSITCGELQPFETFTTLY